MPVLTSPPPLTMMMRRRRRSHNNNDEDNDEEEEHDHNQLRGVGGRSEWLSGGASEVSVSVLQWDKEGRVGRVPSTRTPGGFIKVICEDVLVAGIPGGDNNNIDDDDVVGGPPPRKVLRLCCSDKVSPAAATTSSSQSSGGGVNDTVEVCVCCGTFGLRSEFYKPRYCVSTCFLNCAREELKEVAIRNAPLKLFRQPALPNSNPFKVGMLLEALDPENASLFCVVSVVRVIGCRVELHFEGYPSVFDFFVNADSIDIFPPGWTVESGHELQPPLGLKPSETFSWPQYIVSVRKQPAPRGIFQVVREQQQQNNNSSSNQSSSSSVRVGMKLEAVDIRDNVGEVITAGTTGGISSTGHGICVASVSKVLGERFLVHFDSWDCIYDYWADLTCPFIHPCGFAKANNKVLNPPNSWMEGKGRHRSFEWEEYMRDEEEEKKTSCVSLPAHLFQPLPPVGFKKGMRIEAVDVRRRWLLRPAVVVGVDGHMLTIQYEIDPPPNGGGGGLSNGGDHHNSDHSSSSSGGCLVRVTELSSDIHPVGYARHTNHPISSCSDNGDCSGGVAPRRERVVVVNEGSRTIVVTPGELYGNNNNSSSSKKKGGESCPPLRRSGGGGGHAVMTSTSTSTSSSTSSLSTPPLSPPPILVPPPPAVVPPPSLPISLVAEKMSLLAMRVVLARKKPTAAAAATSAATTPTTAAATAPTAATPPEQQDAYVYEGLLRGLLLNGGASVRSLTVSGVSSVISRVCSEGVVGMLRDQLVDGDALMLLKREDLPALPLGAWVKLNYIKWLIMNCVR